jgi:arylsulfatase
MVTNLRMDPFERASDESVGHPVWAAARMFALAPAGFYVGQWLQSFRDFPPRMKPGSFSLDRVMEAATAAGRGSN